MAKPAGQIAKTHGSSSQTGSEGAISADGLVRGCYLHGLFASDGFRAEILAMLGTHSQLVSYDAAVEDTLDQLAAFIELHLDVDALIALARPVAL